MQARRAYLPLHETRVQATMSAISYFVASTAQKWDI
jgi:hypothetical protein